MTTNTDRAAKIIADAFRPAMRGHADSIGGDLARELHKAGVIAPDLPTVEIDDEGAPYVTVTGCYDDAPGIIRVDADGAFHARNVSSAPTGPAEARERGAAYLALAQHVEGDPRG